MVVWERRTLENRKRIECIFSCFLTSSLTVHPIVELFYKRRVNKQWLDFLVFIYLQRITAPDSNSAFFHERAREVPGHLQSKKCLSDICCIWYIGPTHCPDNLEIMKRYSASWNPLCATKHLPSSWYALKRLFLLLTPSCRTAGKWLMGKNKALGDL